MAKLNWLPENLHHVALRVARADELCHEVIRESFEWSLNDPVEVVRRRRDGIEQLVVRSVDPMPPSVGLYFSEAINHLRAAIDNAVYGLTVSSHDGPLTDRQDKAVEFPIRDDSESFHKWQSELRKKGLVQLVEGPLGRAIEALQPFNDKERALPSITPDLAQKLGMPVDYRHPLLLLQGYSNEDKHRALRPTLHQNMLVTYGASASADRHTQRRVGAGDVLFSAPVGVSSVGEQGPYLAMGRPGRDHVAVAPGKELDRLVRYVAEVAVPTLVTGAARTEGLPPHMNLGGSRLSVEDRIEAAGYERADKRFQPVITAQYVEQMFAPPITPPLEE